MLATMFYANLMLLPFLPDQSFDLNLLGSVSGYSVYQLKWMVTQLLEALGGEASITKRSILKVASK